MKRKTNLFYKTDVDNHFITFSNYTESMTGNFLATDVKLYPSKFLCAYLPSIENNESKREELISYIAARYENKLAFMRDVLAYKGISQDSKMQPLGWLLDSLYDFDNEIEISFVGQVTEQDYNGVYADTICVVDGQACRRGKVVRADEQDYTEYEDYSYQSTNYLYGWYETNEETGVETFAGPAAWNGTAPITDGTEEGRPVYYYNSQTEKITIDEDSEGKDILFNIVIPLFDVINMYTSENNDIIQEMTEIDCHAASSNIINCPLGIWMSLGAILLTRDNTEYGPSWSLTLGSQFKPFPYSFNKVSEVDQDARTEAFMTFAEILTRQNEMISKFSEISSMMANMSTQIQLLQSKVSNIATIYTIDDIRNDIADLQNQVSYLSSKID